MPIQVRQNNLETLVLIELDVVTVFVDPLPHPLQYEKEERKMPSEALPSNILTLLSSKPFISDWFLRASERKLTTVPRLPVPL